MEFHTWDGTVKSVQSLRKESSTSDLDSIEFYFKTTIIKVND